MEFHAGLHFICLFLLLFCHQRPTHAGGTASIHVGRGYFLKLQSYITPDLRCLLPALLPFFSLP